MKKTQEFKNKDFNLQMGFRVKDTGLVEESEVVTIEGYANYYGKSQGEDYSAVYIDRSGEVVVPGGMDVKAYKKNPVILLNHDRSRVIGKALSVTKSDDGIMIKAEIHKGACDDETFYAIKNGLVTTFSIGFRVKAGEFKEINKNNVFFITKSELYETSCVTIPCNAESTFSVVKSLEGDTGFYAGDFDYDVNTDGPTTESDVINKTEDGEDKMKLALADLLSAAEVEKLKSLGVNVEEEQEVSLKQYVDFTVQKAVEAAVASVVEGLKGELKESVKSDEVSEPADNTAANDAGAEDAEKAAGDGTGEDVVKGEADVDQAQVDVATKAFSDLSGILAQLKAEFITEEK